MFHSSSGIDVTLFFMSVSGETLTWRVEQRMSTETSEPPPQLSFAFLAQCVESRRIIAESTRCFSEDTVGDTKESDDTKLETIANASPEKRARFRNASQWGSLMSA